MKQGKVTLVGAGPGDLELLTLKAVRALQSADVLLLDALANPDISTVAPAARVIRVGKRGACKSTPQDFIQRLARRYALQGMHVIRVKGGDALLFGRAGEEIAFLRAAGIRVDLINGISSGAAAACSLGLSLTHRTHSAGVTFITAHMQAGGEPDWHALAGTRTTLVIYMGMSRIRQICDGLAGALDAATPAAIVQQASMPTERRLLSTLGRLANDAESAAMTSPAVILIGAAVGEALLEQDCEPWRSAA